MLHVSRSIHTTHGDFSREQRCSYSSESLRAERLRELGRAIRKKRRIKQHSREARRAEPGIEARALAPQDVPIEVAEVGERIHHPASPADVRAVLGRLPAGTLSGLARIRLVLGAERQEEDLSAEERRDAERDPWLGRVGREILPSVWSGQIIGLYARDSARIDLFAYVYAPDLPDRARWECYLRLKMLATLVHEVAHLEDFELRTARGRWRADDVDKLEAHAEARAAHWVREIVVPWLEETCPEAVEDLRQWLMHHGGTDLPLELLADNGHWNSEGKWIGAVIGGGVEAFEGLARGVHEGGEPSAVRLAFANELHYGDLYDEALRVLERMLRDEPANLDALTLKADIHEHREEYELAEALARRVVEQDAARVDAWKVLGDVYEARADWQRLHDAAGSGVDVAEGEYDRVSFREQKCRALLELGRAQELERELELMGSSRRGVSTATMLRALHLLRSARFQEALDVARTADPRCPRWHRNLLSAVRFEAAQRLGRPGLAGRLSRRTLERLRYQQGGSWAAWADRLVAEFGREIW